MGVSLQPARPSLTFTSLCVRAGQPRDRSPNLRVVEFDGPDGITTLAVGLELRPRHQTDGGSAHGGDELAEQVVQQIIDAFASRGSLTRRLRAAVDQARLALTAPDGGPIRAGLSLLALRGDSAFLAQVGPGLVFVHTDEGAAQVPPPKMWSEALASGEAGTRAGPPPVRWARWKVRGGDVILVADSGLARPMTARAVARLLAEPVAAAMEGLLKLAPSAELTALHVAVGGRGSVVGGRGSGGAFGRPGPDRLFGMALLGARTIVPRLWRGALRVLRGTLPTAEAEVQPSAPQPGSSARLLSPAPQPGSSGPGGSAARLAAWLVVGLPVLVLALTLANWMAHADQVETVGQLVAGAQAVGAAVPREALTDQARQELDKAIALTDRALQRRPGHRLATQVRADLVARREAAALVTRLEGLRAVASLPGARQDRRRLVVVDGVPYVLNRSAGSVVRVTETVQPALSRGALVDDVMVGQLEDLAWVPDTDGGRLLALDAANRLFQILPLLEVVQLNTHVWRQVTHMAGFAGNLYVVDVVRGQILKYHSQANAFERQGRPWLDAALDLRESVDIAIDGYVYLPQSDGSVIRLEAGRQVDYSVAGVDPPLSEPVDVYTSPTAGRLLVADRQPGRIVALAPAGALEQQLLPPVDSPTHAPYEPSFSDLQAVWWDEAQQRLYLVDAGELLAAPYRP
jgi:hypothetical protein